MIKRITLENLLDKQRLINKKNQKSPSLTNTKDIKIFKCCLSATYYNLTAVSFREINILVEKLIKSESNNNNLLPAEHICSIQYYSENTVNKKLTIVTMPAVPGCAGGSLPSGAQHIENIVGGGWRICVIDIEQWLKIHFLLEASAQLIEYAKFVGFKLWCRIFSLVWHKKVPSIAPTLSTIHNQCFETAPDTKYQMSWV